MPSRQPITAVAHPWSHDALSTATTPMPENLETLGRFLLRGLRIGASTVAVVELLRSDWNGGLSAGVAWLLFLLVERRLAPLSPDSDD